MTTRRGTVSPVLLATGLALVVSAETALAAPILNPANGHYYDVVTTSIDWSAANAAANSQTYMGFQGHLATVTTADENRFLTDTFGFSGLVGRWTGGFQPPGSPEPAGGWSWVTGEPFVFNNWVLAEPNNFQGENAIEFAHLVNANGAGWNDANGSRQLAGYVIEFEPTQLPVPEPSSMVLLGFGVASLVGYHWKRRRAGACPR